MREYFAVDPNGKQLWPDKTTRVKGWRYVDNQAQVLPADIRGWVWSETLESWVGAEGTQIELYDREGHKRLNAEAAAQRAEQLALQAEETARRAEETARRAEETTRQRQEAERAAKEKAWAKLRELGIDPESL